MVAITEVDVVLARSDQAAIECIRAKTISCINAV